MSAPRPPSVSPAILTADEREHDYEYPTIRLATGWRVGPGRVDLELARDMLALLPSGPAYDLVAKMIEEIRDYREVYG